MRDGGVRGGGVRGGGGWRCMVRGEGWRWVEEEEWRCMVRDGGVRGEGV